MPVWSNAATVRTWLSFVTARLRQKWERTECLGWLWKTFKSHYSHPSRLPLIKFSSRQSFRIKEEGLRTKSCCKERVVIRYALSCYVVILVLVEWCLVAYVFCFMSVSVCQKVPLLWQDNGPQPHPPGEQGSGGRGQIWPISCKQRYSWTTLYFNTVPVISNNLH